MSIYVGDEIFCVNNFNFIYYLVIKLLLKGIFFLKKVLKCFDIGLWLFRIFFGIFKLKCGGEKGIWSRGLIFICISYFVIYVVFSVRMDEVLF